MGIRISFVGDISTSNGYEKLADHGIHPFKDLRLCFEKAVELLGVLPFNLMTLSNNHLLDSLEEGFYKTKKCLIDLGIKSF